MEFILSSGFLVTIMVCLVGPGFLLAIVIGFFKFKKQLKSNTDRRELLLSGATEPAIVISARNNYFTGGGKNRSSTAVNVTFEVDVQPASQLLFRAKFKESLPIREADQLGERPGEAGTKVWVTYDPNNKSRIVLDHYDSNHEYAMKRKEFDLLDKRDSDIRRTGMEAVATILEVEDLKLTNKVEREFLEKTIMRLRLEVSLKGEPSYQADTKGMFLNSGLHKYTVGQKVIVKINPKDRTQVALVSSTEK